MLVIENERPDDAIEANASLWFARQRMGGLSSRDQAALDAWLQSDPRHAAALASMSHTFEQIASLKSLAELEPLQLTERRRAPLRAGLSRRAGIAAALSSAAAALVAVVLLPGVMQRPDLDQSTGVGEVRTLTLADGSRVTLGARSRIKVDFDGDARRVALTDGEAFFEVTPDAARPFYVDTGVSMVRVVGTKFDVRRAAGHVDVAVLEGVVEVRERALLQVPETRTLRAGQRVRAEQREFASIRAPVSQIGAVERSASGAGAWRNGQLTYDDATLGDVIADLNRYYAPGVRVEGDALRAARLAASFKADELDAFLEDLPRIVAVEVRKEASGAIVISKRDEGVSGPAG